MAKYKVPNYIRSCDKCGQGRGYHSEGVNYRICDNCFKSKCDTALDQHLALLRESERGRVF